MNSGGSADEERFDNLKKIIPTPDTFKKYRLAPADFEKVSHPNGIRTLSRKMTSFHQS